MVVTWQTGSPTPDSVCEYGIGGFTKSASGSFREFVDGGKKNVIRYIHKVTLVDLKPCQKYGNCHYKYISLCFTYN